MVPRIAGRCFVWELSAVCQGTNPMNAGVGPTLILGGAVLGLFFIGTLGWAGRTRASPTCASSFVVCGGLWAD